MDRPAVTAPQILMLVGPSQIGKDSLIARLESEQGFSYHLNASTRAPRQPAGLSHAEYEFLSREQFHAKVLSGHFVDWDYYAGNYYGVTRPSDCESRAVMHCGARMSIRIAQRNPEYLPVFLMPRDRVSHQARILSTFPEKEGTLRLAMMNEELSHAPMFEQVIDVASYASTDDVLEELLTLLSIDGESGS